MDGDVPLSMALRVESGKAKLRRAAETAGLEADPRKALKESRV